MSTTIPLHTMLSARATGAALMVAFASRRYGHTDAQAQLYARDAAAMVRHGHSAARAIEAMKSRARREAPPPSAA